MGEDFNPVQQGYLHLIIILAEIGLKTMTRDIFTLKRN